MVCPAVRGNSREAIMETNVSRRDFLKGSIVVALGAAGCYAQLVRRRRCCSES
ncbi:MAG: twin-arginine translocation signal domain-containing protein [Eggerthellaceae bacterium]